MSRHSVDRLGLAVVGIVIATVCGWLSLTSIRGEALTAAVEEPGTVATPATATAAVEIPAEEQRRSVVASRPVAFVDERSGRPLGGLRIELSSAVEEVRIVRLDENGAALLPAGSWSARSPDTPRAFLPATFDHAGDTTVPLATIGHLAVEGLAPAASEAVVVAFREGADGIPVEIDELLALDGPAWRGLSRQQPRDVVVLPIGQTEQPHELPTGAWRICVRHPHLRDVKPRDLHWGGSIGDGGIRLPELPLPCPLTDTVLLTPGAIASVAARFDATCSVEFVPGDLLGLVDAQLMLRHCDELTPGNTVWNVVRMWNRGRLEAHTLTDLAPGTYRVGVIGRSTSDDSHLVASSVVFAMAEGSTSVQLDEGVGNRSLVIHPDKPIARWAVTLLPDKNATLEHAFQVAGSWPLHAATTISGLPADVGFVLLDLGDGMPKRHEFDLSVRTAYSSANWP